MRVIQMPDKPQEREMINVYSGSEDWRGRLLSNFAPTPFQIDGRTAASFEGFYQALKWPEGSGQRDHCLTLVGLAAKRFGEEAPQANVFLWGRQIIRVGSPEHHNLLRRALMAKFTQNHFARKALLATGDAELIHELPHYSGPEKSVFPSNLFCKMLMQIRDTLRDQENAELQA